VPDVIVTIKAAVPEDLEGLTALLKTLFSIEGDFVFDETRQRRGLQMMLDNPRGCILAAEADGCVIGMCSGQLTVSTAEGGPAVLIEDVVVHEDWQGRGVGRRLMEGIGDWASKNKASRLQLLADRNNAPALVFYKNLGWKTTKLICLRKGIEQ
jgi:GNAT superfamily N-acetyltransferase